MTFSSPELVVVDIHGKAFLNLLLDIVVHNYCCPVKVFLST